MTRFYTLLLLLSGCFFEDSSALGGGPQTMPGEEDDRVVRTILDDFRDSGVRDAASDASFDEAPEPEPEPEPTPEDAAAPELEDAHTPDAQVDSAEPKPPAYEPPAGTICGVCEVNTDCEVGFACSQAPTTDRKRCWPYAPSDFLCSRKCSSLPRVHDDGAAVVCFDYAEAGEVLPQACLAPPGVFGVCGL